VSNLALDIPLKKNLLLYLESPTSNTSVKLGAVEPLGTQISLTGVGLDLTTLLEKQVKAHEAQGKE
jgi:hypothetical protein